MWMKRPAQPKTARLDADTMVIFWKSQCKIIIYNLQSKKGRHPLFHTKQKEKYFFKKITALCVELWRFRQSNAISYFDSLGGTAFECFYYVQSCYSPVSDSNQKFLVELQQTISQVDFYWIYYEYFSRKIICTINKDVIQNIKLHEELLIPFHLN